MYDLRLGIIFGIPNYPGLEFIVYRNARFSILNSSPETYFFVHTPEENSFVFSIFLPKEMVIDFL